MAPLMAKIEALTAEVAALRADQQQQTGDTIRANYDANDRAAGKVVDGTVQAAKESAWAKQSKMVIA
jgi:hypothetical protein